MEGEENRSMKRLKEELIDSKALSPETLDRMDQKIADEVREAFEFAKSSLKPEPADLLRFVEASEKNR